MAAGMPVERVCEILGVSQQEWTSAIQYWAANFPAMMASDPGLVAQYQSYAENPRQGKFAAVAVAAPPVAQPVAAAPVSPQPQNAAAAPKVASGARENNLEYFTKTAPGVFVLKKPIRAAIIAMAVSWVPLLILLVAQVAGYINVDMRAFAFVAVVGVIGSAVVLIDMLVKTVIDVNQRTVTGLFKRFGFLKLKSTFSFDAFHGFFHVTKTRRASQYSSVRITVATRLDMTFLHNGKSKRHLTLTSDPREEVMDAICSEISFLMRH